MTIPTRIVPEPGTFGATLRQVREERGLSQSRLAMKAGYDHSYISRIELDRRNPTRGAVLNLAAAMFCTELEEDMLLLSAGYAPASETVRGAIQRAMDDLRYRAMKRDAWNEVAGD